MGSSLGQTTSLRVPPLLRTHVDAIDAVSTPNHWLWRGGIELFAGAEG
jgi:hypothetical protein